MALVQFLISVGLIFVFTFGQIFRITFHEITFPLIDVFIIALAAFNLLNHLLDKTKPPVNKYFLTFLVFTWISFFVNHFYFNYPLLKPLFYLLRLSSLTSLFIYPVAINRHSVTLHNLLIMIITSNVIFGLIQYFIWPDFTYFNSLNWDPHLYRLVSSFFDPTFTALIYLLFFIYLFLNFSQYPRFISSFLLVISYFALALTYSRSTYLALIAAAIYFAVKSSQKYLAVLSLILVTFTILVLPRQPGEGTKLERTSSVYAKVHNYQEALAVFASSPIIGHGYNNLPYIRQIDNYQSHSNNGFDSSLLTILCTTGIIGLVLFILGGKQYFQNSSLTIQVMIVAIIIHSLFANSLLYPWTIIFLFFIRYRKLR